MAEVANGVPGSTGASSFEASILDEHRDAVATLLLDAYRGTIEDEGEDPDDAPAIDHCFASIVRPQSLVLLDGDRPVAFSFVVAFNDLHHIDPVVVAANRKRGAWAAWCGPSPPLWIESVRSCGIDGRQAT